MDRRVLIALVLIVALLIIVMVVATRYSAGTAPVVQPAPVPAAPVVPAPRDPMSLIALSELGTGRDYGAGNVGSFRCNSRGDDQVGAITGYYDQYINGLQLQCKYPTATGAANISPVFGQATGKPFSLTGPFYTLTGKGGSWIDNFAGYGGSGGNAWSSSCPAGTALVGADVTYGKYVGKVAPYCA